MTIKKTRNPVWVFTAVAALSILGFITNTFHPETIYHVTVFIGLISLTLFSLVNFFLVNTRQAILIAFFTAGTLTLRFLGLKQIVFPLLLASLLLTIEWYLREP